MKKSILVFMALLMMALMPTAVSAASTSIYKDVTSKTVDEKSRSAIAYVKGYNGWDGLIKNGMFYPNSNMTKHEFYIMLKNLYGNKVPSSVVSACKNNKQTMTSQFVCDQFVRLGKNLGYDIKWTGTKSTMKRKDVARYTKIFATFNKRFVPTKKSTSSTKTETSKTEKEVLLELLKKLLGL